MIKLMSISEYCKLRPGKDKDITSQAIRKAIKLGHNIPGVISHTKSGSIHILKVRLNDDGTLDIKPKK